MLTLNQGDSQWISFTLIPPDADISDIVWSSSSSTVISVTSSGYLTANNNGNATITVETADGNISDSCSVTVESNVVWADQYVVTGKETMAFDSRVDMDGNIYIVGLTYIYMVRQKRLSPATLQQALNDG